MLEHLNYTVLTAENGHEALDVYQQHRSEIELVVTDLTMPKMGGAELTKILHQQDPDLKIIALTGYPLDANSKQALIQGDVAWLQKPLDLPELAQTLSDMLDNNQMETL